MVVHVRCAGLAAGGQEQPGRRPALAPLRRGERGAGQVVPGPGQACAADDDGRVSAAGAPLGSRKPGGQDLQAPLFAGALGLVTGPRHLCEGRYGLP